MATGRTYDGRGSTFRSEVAFANGKLYVVSSNDGALRCVNAARGLEEWAWDPSETGIQGQLTSLSAPALDAEKAYYVLRADTSRAHLVSVSIPDAGERPHVQFVSNESIGYSTIGSPAIAQDTIVIGAVAFARPEAVRLVIEVPERVSEGEFYTLTVKAVDENGLVDTGFYGDVVMLFRLGGEEFPYTMKFTPDDRGTKSLRAQALRTGSYSVVAHVADRPGIQGEAKWVVGNWDNGVVESPKADPGDGFIALEWTVKEGGFPAETVRIHRREGPSGAMLFRDSVSALTTRYLDSDVENDVEYSYAFTVIDSKGHEGTMSVEVTATPSTVDWPMLQRHARHSGYQAQAEISAPLGERWSIALPAQPGKPVFMPEQSPIFVSGTVYATSTGGAVCAYLACASETTTLWERIGTDFIGCLGSPAYQHGRIYFTCEYGLFVLDAATGNIAWNLPSETVGSGTESSPIAYKGAIFAGQFLGGAHRLVAVDIETEQLKWMSPAMKGPLTSPAAAGGGVYVVDRTGVARFFTPDSPVPAWTCSLGSSVEATPAVDTSTGKALLLAVRQDGDLACLDSETRNLKWAKAVEGGETSPACGNGTVIASSKAGNTVYARDVAAGGLKWKAEMPIEAYILLGAPIIAGDRAYVYSVSGKVFGIDLATGAVEELVDLGTELDQAHLAAGGTDLYLTTAGGELKAITPVAPAPTGLIAEARQTEIFLSWTPPDRNVFEILGYEIHRSEEQGTTGELLDRLDGASASSFTDTTAQPAVEYFYRVRAMDERGVGGRFSDEASATVQLPPAHQFIATKDAGRLLDMDFFGAQSGWVVGTGNHRSLHFDGQSWSPVTVPAPPRSCMYNHAQAVSLTGPADGFMSADTFCIVSGRPTYGWFRYAISGNAWQTPALGLDDAAPAGLAMVSATDGWQGLSTNTGPRIYRYNGTSWTSFQGEPNGAFEHPSILQKIRFVREQPSHGWALDNNGDFCRFAESQWEAVAGSSMLGLWMNSPGDAWACGFNGMIMHYSDQAGWSAVQTPPAASDGTLKGIAFFDAEHGVAVGGRDPSSSNEEPVILACTNGTWRVVPAPPPAELADVRLTEVRMIGTNEAWAIGQATETETSQQTPVLMRIGIPFSPAPLESTREALVAFSGSGEAASIPQDMSISCTRLADSVVFSFEAPVSCRMKLTILTQELWPVRVMRWNAPRGRTQVAWDGMDEKGTRVKGGWYLAKIESAQAPAAHLGGLTFELLPHGSPDIVSGGEIAGRAGGK